MPDQMVTPAEMDCCKGMAGDCSSATISQACCQTVVRTDVGIVAKVLGRGIPHQDAFGTAADFGLNLPFNFDHETSRQAFHGPPDKPGGGSSLILRI
jgi:hypothetical protein